MINFEKDENKPYFTEQEKLELLTNEHLFLQNVLKYLNLSDEDRKQTEKRMDEIVEKKKEIVENLMKKRFIIKSL